MHGPFPEQKLPRKLPWANSILQRNNKLHCIYCGDLVRHNTWFKTRQDNGIVLVFNMRECEKKYDIKFAADVR